MRVLAALTFGCALLAGCFPDADKLRTPTTGNTGGVPGSGGTGPSGGTGGSSGVGGMATAGASGTGGTPGTDGGPGGNGGAPGPTRAQLCGDLATAVASKTFRCAAFTASVFYGSQSAYTSRLQTNCILYDAPGVQFPPVPFQRCADAYATLSCEDWLDGNFPAVCQASGTFPEGAACGSGFQCATDLCDLTSGAACGHCIRPPTAGAPCFSGLCDVGLVCNANQVCTVPRTRGADCDTANPCRPSLGCVAGTCAPRAPPHAACQADDECDFYNGSVCDTGLKACVPATTGPSCRLNADGSRVYCAGAGTCNSTDGSCLAAAADGAACVAMTGPNCQWPAMCATDGHCRLPQFSKTCGGTKASLPAPPLDLFLDHLPRAQGVRQFLGGRGGGRPSLRR